MKQVKKILAVTLALVLALSLLPAANVSAASKKVKLNKKKATIYVGKTVTLKLKNNKKKVKWSSSNKKVATVTKKGKVKGKKAGKVTITAKVGKKKYKCKITVKKKVTTKPTVPSKPTEQPTTRPASKPTEKPTEQPTTKPTEQPKPEIESNDDWQYIVTEKGITLVNYIGKDIDIVLPSEINGKAVTSIGEAVFGEMDEGCTYSDVSSITIPKSITSIKNNAFESCVIFKDKFINNSSLNAEEANYWGLHFYDEKSNGMYILDKQVVHVIDTDITEVIIPEGVTGIQASAFYGCGKINKIVIPSSVTYINYWAFGECFILKENFINNSELNAESADYWGAIAYDKEINGLCIKNNTVVDVVDKEITEVIIPDGITRIGAGVFRGCSKLKDIVIPDSVTYIGADAFASTKWLDNQRKENPLVIVNHILLDGSTWTESNIVIPDGVTQINDDAFSYCDKIENVKMPNSVTYIGVNAFWGCENIKNIEISSGVKEISIGAFSWCTSLTSIVIPESVTQIGINAFTGCSKLSNIVIPESVTDIGDDAFEQTQWLENLKKENALVIINNILIGSNCAESEIIIPDGVTKINGGVFSDCNNLISVTIPESVISIGRSPFIGCINFSHIKGKAGSYAETWAEENRYKFMAQ